VSLEALLLGLTTIVRPTSAAAVYAILCSRRPQRLLVAYLAVGLTFSVGIGVAVVLAFQGHDSSIMTTARRAVVDIVLGALALGYAAGVWTGRLRRGAAHHHDEGSWLQRRMHHLTPAVAALIGIVTHLPGIVYLAALNAIIGSATRPANSVLQVIVYNALWFSLPIVALTLSIIRPTVSRDMLERGTAWARNHQRTLVVAFSLVLGVYLMGKGILDLHNAST
jgi:hypothetical protein